MSTVVITGAGPQLGMSIARRFGREGFSVALLARRRDPLAELAADLRDQEIDAEAFPADIRDPDSLRTAPELFYDALPSDWHTRRVADKFIVDQDR